MTPQMKLARRIARRALTTVQLFTHPVRWFFNREQVPPPHWMKQQIVRNYARRTGARILVETGTYRGDMVAAMSGDFGRIYSIELGQELSERAQKRFRNQSQIQILQGDSARVLPELMSRLDGPTLFWLDGHFSGGDTAQGEEDSPVMDELRIVLSQSSPACAVLIDDARCFLGEGGYPKIDELEGIVLKLNPNWRFERLNDIVRLTKRPLKAASF